MDAEFVHLRLFDLGAEVDLRRVATLNGLPAAEAPVVSTSPVPAYSSFSRPLEVRFPLDVAAPGGATVELRVHAIGALAIRVRWTAGAVELDRLHEQAARWPGMPASFDEYAARLSERVRAELAPALRSQYNVRVEPERYLVYCLHVGPGETARLLTERRARLAALVSDQADDVLVPMRTEAAFRHLLQYGPDDAVLPGWDHAVILDTPGGYEDMLDVMEVANLELLEFRAYDAYVDNRLESSFDALDRLWSPGGLFRSARSALQDISRVRVELARLTDNLHDTGKIFGDWYTAQLHQRLHARFHLASWERAVAGKMEALEDMFHMAQEEANHRRSLMLEVFVTLLFVLDLIILVRAGA